MRAVPKLTDLTSGPPLECEAMLRESPAGDLESDDGTASIAVVDGRAAMTRPKSLKAAAVKGRAGTSGTFVCDVARCNGVESVT